MGSFKNICETQCPLFLTSSSGLGLEKGAPSEYMKDHEGLDSNIDPSITFHHHDEPDQCFIFTKWAFSPPTKPRFSRGAFNKNVGMGLQTIINHYVIAIT